MTEDIAGAITDHVAAFLLRYFRPAVAADAKVIRIDAERDRDLLRLQWALSATVTRLADYILAHRHETQSFLVTRERSDSGTVRGRIDARATLLKRTVGGDPAIVVAHEPVRSFDSGPNHVTVWVLQQAWLLAGRFSALLPSDATYRTSSDAAVGRLERVRKIGAISAAMAEINLFRRPSAGALRAAAQSRRRTYRLAYEAYSTLAAVEAGDTVAIEMVLRDTLVAPIEIWRRFELATALAMAEALAGATGVPMRLNILAGGNRMPIASIGRFAIFWQSRTNWYVPPKVERSEAVVRAVLARFGLGPDQDRPDLVVADLETDRVVAVVEAKYFTAAAEDALDRLREATHQVVRYARGYRVLEEIDPLLERSAIALVRRPDVPQPACAPAVLGFEDMIGGERLARWAEALV
ncbi:hypothetical protein QE363_000135 [Sphingomonas sp. SORGH_AS870]|uniref:hypothetical protein n=1 Tax=Sphingomonas sp. SORGH_AS_0870 TaxID=3041801 RepID=UPI002857B826|nr:hypothetical protein [Sphingomonas sp. SORGH_AS_0870]MDR6144342.1 hypothetical protein [Sphingomonas sp. SORGH_AS_0870]